MADPDAYTAAVKKGKVLLTAMKASPNSPVQHSQPSTWTSYNSFEKHGWKRDHSQEVEIYKDGVTTELAGIMRKHNVSIGSPNNIAICWQHHATTTRNDHWMEILSPAKYLETETASFDNASIPAGLPVLQHWSDITFLQWQELASKPTELQGLRRVMHRKVSNENTKAIIKHVLEKRGKFETREVIAWTEKNLEGDGDDFLALLGSPNGYGTAFMLAQHKAQLGWKSVKSITVYQSKQRILVFELEDLSSAIGYV